MRSLPTNYPLNTKGRALRPFPHVSGYFFNSQLFLSRFKDFCVHTDRYSNRICPSTRIRHVGRIQPIGNRACVVKAGKREPGKEVAILNTVFRVKNGRHLIPSTKLTSSSHKTFHFSYMKFLDEMFIKVKVSSIFKEKNNSG